MFEDQGESAKLALSYAVQYSQKLNHFYIGTEHLFLGVLDLDDVNIENAFSRAGLDAERVKTAILDEVGIGVSSHDDQVFITDRAQLVIALAMVEAHRLGRSKVEAPDFLVAILEDGRGVPARVITKLGGNKDELDLYLDDMLTSGQWSPDFYEQRKKVEQPGIDNSSELLENLGRDLTEIAAEGGLDPIIGREEETLQLIQILLTRKKSNPIIVGDAGVGKTAVVEGLAQLMVSGNAPPELKGKHLRTVEVGALLSGTMYRGDLEKKVLEFINEAREDKDLIVFIDEIHMLIKGGVNPTDPMDPANLLKPALSRGDFKCIGATTYPEYRKYIEQDPAMARRFQPLYVGEPSPEDTIKILEGLRRKYEDFHNVKILDETLEAAVSMSGRYITDRRLPDKAIDLIDQACSQRKLRSYYNLSDIDRLTKEEKKAVFSGEAKPPKATILLISRNDIARVVSSWTGIPVGRLTIAETERLTNMEALIKKRIVGQEEAVSAIAQAIRTSRSGLKDPKRPVGVFLFLGPTGVGKTELARTLAEVLFDDEERIVRVDMSECYDDAFITRLIGSPPGYKDSDVGGQLTEAIKQHPYSIVLFDEVEKSDSRVRNLMLQVMEDGRLTDGLGRLVNFRSTVIIMTSNVGSAEITGIEETIGFVSGSKAAGKKAEASPADVKVQAMNALERAFLPEFLNRIDETIVFDPLTREDLREIASIMLSRIPMRVTASRKALDLLVEEGFNPAMGARPLRRAIQELVVEPLANKLIRGEFNEKDLIALGMSAGKLTFTRKEAGPSGRQ